jgi:hypothetical protein
MNLGLVFPSVKNSPADLVVKSWPQKKVIMAGECKLYKAKVDAGTLKSRVLNKFEKYPECRLFIAIAPDFTEARDTLFGDFCVWIFRRNSSKKLEQVVFTDSQPVKAEKHVILLQLSELCSSRDEIFFAKIIKSFHDA